MEMLLLRRLYFPVRCYTGSLQYLQKALASSVGVFNSGDYMREGSEINEPDVLYKKLVITVKGHEPMVLKSYETFVKQVCDNLSIALKSETRNRPTFFRLSMNKSPFIYKKQQRQYEFRTHYQYFTVDHITGCTADVFLEYIQRNLPEGVAMEVVKHRLERLPEHL
ncbi:unnamed protein product [Schistosoma rodhaini]|uniref:Small ribosomal subunit protein uS10m n=1 Tax=Schistosoma rodhaini TaxID=6188 RepID=A0AA85FCK6_9TREM|nr:unnamed protein product [Schistosoma rodhaini]CAH8498037.1 unnamed protein product [Schistosoma rodhaini]